MKTEYWGCRRVAEMVGILAILLILTACDDDPTVPPPRESARESFSQDLDGAGLSVLVLEGVNGNVQITGMSADDLVHVQGNRVVWSDTREDAEAHLDDLQVQVEVREDTLRIKTIQPTDDHDREYEVDYEIVVPQGLEILAANANGTIEIVSIRNDIIASLANGNITLQGIVGNVIANLANGIIDCEATLPLDGAFSIAVANGNIGLRIPAETSAQFMASVANGAIATVNLDFHNSVISETSLSGTLGDGRGSISLAAGNGSITAMGF